MRRCPVSLAYFSRSEGEVAPRNSLARAMDMAFWLPQAAATLAVVNCQQHLQSTRRNVLPTKRINVALLMRWQHPASALVELMQIGKTLSGSDRALHHPPKTFDGIEVMTTMRR